MSIDVPLDALTAENTTFPIREENATDAIQASVMTVSTLHASIQIESAETALLNFLKTVKTGTQSNTMDAQIARLDADGNALLLEKNA